MGFLAGREDADGDVRAPRAHGDVAALLTEIADQERLDAATELISGAELTDCLAEIGRNGR